MGATDRHAICPAKVGSSPPNTWARMREWMPSAATTKS
jgi:hypothetical protein